MAIMMAEPRALEPSLSWSMLGEVGLDVHGAFGPMGNCRCLRCYVAPWFSSHGFAESA